MQHALEGVVDLGAPTQALGKTRAPTGMIMNSWKSTLLSACTPPLRMFIMGVGSRWALTPPRYWYSDRPADSAAARATASDTPRMALAPGSYKFAASITKVADGQATLSVYGYDSYLPEDIDALQEGSVFRSTTRATPP